MSVHISERGVNIHFYPIMGTVSPGDIKRKNINNENLTFVAKENSRWDLNCYKVMDYFSSEIRIKFNQWFISRFGRICKNSYDPLISTSCVYLSRPDRIDEYNEEQNRPGFAQDLRVYNLTIERTTFQLLKSPFLKKMSSKTLKETLRKISTCHASCNYQILSEGSTIRGGIRTHDFSHSYKMIDRGIFDTLFNYELIKGKIGKDNILYGSIHKIYFNTPLGSIFLHNIYTGGYNVIFDLEKFYSLSKYAQLLYRKRFFSWSKLNKIILRSDKVMNDLSFNKSNTTDLKKKFQLIVEELVDNEFIEAQKIKPDGKILRFECSTKKQKIRKVLPFQKK